jgi:hypothetical protein
MQNHIRMVTNNGSKTIADLCPLQELQPWVAVLFFAAVCVVARIAGSGGKEGAG